jgi:hypothetical protein
MLRTSLLARGLTAASIAAFALTGSLSAQTTRTTQPTAPGWVFTPSIGVAETWDSNVLLRGEGSGSLSDFLTAVNPAGALGYRGKRATFHIDYRGSFYLYQELSDLNAFDQREAVDYRYRMTSKVSFFARQSLSKSPTTDDVDIPGVEFRRQGVLHNDIRSGLETRFNSRAVLTASYNFQQVDFDDDPLLPLDALRSGGHAHGASAQFDYRLGPRASVGAEYDMRHATVDVIRNFDVMNTMGTVDYRLNERLQLSGGAGFSRLATSDVEASRMAPAFRVGLNGTGARFAWNVSYRRSFLPSFGFGGTFENQEFLAGFLAPLTRRLDWSSTLAIRESDPLVRTNDPLLADDPLLNGDLGLRTIWARSSISFLANRWMRIEGFYNAALQNSQRPGGKVNRSRVGVQVVTYKRLRVR